MFMGYNEEWAIEMVQERSREFQKKSKVGGYGRAE